LHIWERASTLGLSDLEDEAVRRDEESRRRDGLAGSIRSDAVGTVSQSELPTIWGAGWEPSSALEFPTPLNSSWARDELLRFVAERHDGHLDTAASCWDEMGAPESFGGVSFYQFSKSYVSSLEESLQERLLTPSLSSLVDVEVIPRRSGLLHLERRTARLLLDIALCLRRISHYASITLEQRIEWQRMMMQTRLVDEHLKDLSTNGIPTPDGGTFGGKGFRSTWQEGVVACASAMRRAIDIPEGERARADIVAPMIRDVGLALAMGQTPTEVFAAQMGKSGSYMDGGQEGSGGRDLHIGNWEKGVLPPTAPLPIASATTTGIALAASRLSIDRFHLAPVGEGCSSNGEFWEAMNLAGARGLPISFMIQNNQIALDTFVTAQSGVETYGDKGHAMGMPAWTMDGSDPGLFYASTAVAREFATAGGGPTLIHVETMRGCGHAHHHDDLYLGAVSGNPPGYVDRELLTYWAEKDPLPNHRELLIQFGADDKELESMEEQEQVSVDAARDEMMEMPWPEGNTVTRGVTSLHDAASHSEQYDRFGSEVTVIDPPLAPGESSLEFSEATNTWTYSRAIQNGMVSIAEKYGDRAVFMGEDMEIAGAFGMMLSLIAKGHSDKLLDMPLSESVIVHSATGAALGGMRPVAEIQFGGFAALAMNALVNNAAQLRWRWGANVPITVRIPLGAKTRSGPFHANMIESWFLNDPGLGLGVDLTNIHLANDSTLALFDASKLADYFTGVQAGDLVGALILGVLAGLGGRSMAWLVRWSKGQARQTSFVPRVLVGGALLAGLAVAAEAAFGAPLTIGPGIEAMEWVVEPDRGLGLIALLFGLRIAATLVTLGSGGVGGLFIPLAVQGVILGQFTGIALGTDRPGLYPTLGLAAFLGAGYRAPISAVMFVAESTGGSFVVPALVAAALSQLVAGKSSVAEHQQSVRLGHLERRFTLPITSALTTDVLTVPPDATAAEFVYAHVLGRRERSVPVVDGGTYVGMISLSEVSAIERSTWDSTPVAELLQTGLPAALPSWSLRDAAVAMEDAHVDVLAVVDAEGAFIGILRADDILKLDEILEETGG